MQDERRREFGNNLDDPVEKMVERIQQRSLAERRQERQSQRFASFGVGEHSSLTTVTRQQPTIMDKVYAVKVSGAGKENAWLIF